MRSSILYRYILAFLGLTLIVLLASLGVSLWSFERGFIGYVNDIEQLRLEQAQVAVADEYQRSGENWDSLHHRRLERLLLESAPEESVRDPEAGNRRAAGRREGRPPRGSLPFPPTAVYDVAGNFVAGANLEESKSELNRAAIIVDGVTVGELRSAQRHQLSSPQEEAFLERQVKALWIIGLAAMALALAISFVLARGMLSPIQRMQRDVNDLSDGDYSIRLDSRRKDELGDLMRNLDRLAVTLDESRNSRQRWFANVSHELRTPVAVLAGELEAMQDGVRPMGVEQIESLQQEVRRLCFLIDDLYELSVSDIGGLRYEFTSLELDESLTTVAAGYTTRAKERGVELSLSTETLRIKADPQRIDQLWHNLFSNAIEYTEAPGKVIVQAFKEGRYAVVLMEDSPPGVDAEECELLFEPLYRKESSRSRRTGGAGLGLAICRNVAEAHGGTISASPSSLGGVSIRLEFPLLELSDD